MCICLCNKSYARKSNNFLKQMVVPCIIVLKFCAPSFRENESTSPSHPMGKKLMQEFLLRQAFSKVKTILRREIKGMSFDIPVRACMWYLPFALHWNFDALSCIRPHMMENRKKLQVEMLPVTTTLREGMRGGGSKGPQEKKRLSWMLKLIILQQLRLATSICYKPQR